MSKTPQFNQCIEEYFATVKPGERICALTGKKYNVDQAEIDYCKKLGVPVSKWHPKVRLQNLMAFRTMRRLYYRKCDFTKKEIVSTYPQDHPQPVYHQEIWFSDKWNAADYGQDDHPAESFFAQYQRLRKKVPVFALQNTTNENSEYNNRTQHSKNCYMAFGINNSESIFYSWSVTGGRDCMDCNWTPKCEISYMCADCDSCYDCRYGYSLKNCRNIAFSHDLIGCQDCLLCHGLRNKRYFIKNKPYSEEQYKNEIKKYFPLTYSRIKTLQQDFIEFLRTFPRKYATIDKSESCTGEMLFSCHQCSALFFGNRADNVHNSIMVTEASDMRDCAGATKVGGLIYRTSGTNGGYNNRFGVVLFDDNQDTEYCENCVSCKSCFGCVGLQRQRYHILNKPYTEKAYFEKIDQIKCAMLEAGEYGEYLPFKDSFITYNDSYAQAHFPLNKKEALRIGATWNDEGYRPLAYTDNDLKSKKVVLAKDIADDITEIKDDILDSIIVCEKSKRGFRLIKQELEFYRKHKLPIPHLHPDVRYEQLASYFNEVNLYKRTCAKCREPIQTTYAPERPEIVYCEKCYQQTIN